MNETLDKLTKELSRVLIECESPTCNDLTCYCRPEDISVIRKRWDKLMSGPYIYMGGNVIRLVPCESELHMEIDELVPVTCTFMVQGSCGLETVVNLRELVTNCKTSEEVKEAVSHMVRDKAKYLYPSMEILSEDIDITNVLARWEEARSELHCSI